MNSELNVLLPFEMVASQMVCDTPQLVAISCCFIVTKRCIRDELGSSTQTDSVNLSV